MFPGLSTTVLDSVAPVKEVRIKNQSDPWISAEILESIRERDSWLHLVNQLPKQEFNSYDVDSPVFKNQYKSVVPDSFQLQEINEEFVLNEIHSLDISKSTGLDGIPGRFIKDAAESGVVPNDMKIAKVIPLHKKKSKLEAGNYRPVSILSVVSKFLEKAVFHQLNDYLVNNNLIYQFQSGFRGSYSTDTCLIHLQDHIRKQTAAGNYTGMILLDIQKAFDSVDHQILCNKLSAMGVHSTSIDWFQSYLSGRRQVVSINRVESDP
ncbi:putative RNA-directed DNA polymerase from mobile element jockey-like [Apostichopus japonicus]|uniref:Putative RNA-directed DNA polymerase from mobile element jockey-like n=1 Tax=Stichopus japonicus TaxID=307972 RepID=A0A2G8K1V5_STIJA|nr:putative RNA-directed DNA polymerase from mobile element jockey-like [Apostichopus japonicus]